MRCEGQCVEDDFGSVGEDFNGIGLSNQWRGDPLWGRDFWLRWDGSMRRVMAVGEINSAGLKLSLCGWYLWEEEMRQHTKMRQHIDMSDQVGSFSVQDNYPIAIELVFKMDDQTS